MKTVRDGCVLQDNALSIRVSDQVEQLDQLIEAEGDGAAFFAKTYLTHGLRDLIDEGLARLAGSSSQAVFHLKQAMGLATRSSSATSGRSIPTPIAGSGARACSPAAT